MSPRAALLVLGGLILLGAACAEPPSRRLAKYPPVPGVEPGSTPEEVKAVLKADPARVEPGYWTDSYRFDMDFEVWHYRRIGRVIFDRFDMTVAASEADPR